jgi:hypothetical protein
MPDVPSAAPGRAAAATNWQSIFTVSATIGVKLDADMRALALGGDAQVRKRSCSPSPPPAHPQPLPGPTTICRRRPVGHRKSQKKHPRPSLFDRCPLEAFIRPLAPARSKVTRRVSFAARHRHFKRRAAIPHLSNSLPLTLLLPLLYLSPTCACSPPIIVSASNSPCHRSSCHVLPLHWQFKTTSSWTSWLAPHHHLPPLPLRRKRWE